MSDHTLNAAAILENAHSLAAALVIDVEQAEELLGVFVLVTADPEDGPGLVLAGQVCELLVRTLRHASLGLVPAAAEIEVVMGTATPRSAATKVWVSTTSDAAHVSRTPALSRTTTALHPAVSLVVACYVAGATIRMAVGDSLRLPSRDALTLDLKALGVTPTVASGQVNLGRAYLAGAGAIGNAFLWALRWFDVSGQLDVVDFDIVKQGNLNRQMWFAEADVNLSKAQCLAARAQASFPKLALVPRQGRLQDLPEKADDPRWLRCLVVAVDSRMGRRSLQSELPGEVFDASTTDTREIVLHFNKQPTAQACLACIYPPDDAETGRAQDIALALGVTVDDVHRGFIDRLAAGAILARYPNRGLTIETLEGEAYDSLFKALCAQAALQTPEGRQTFAPFAFVSVLAGTLLAIEMVRRLSGEDARFNMWKVSPWLPFLPGLQRQIPATPECSVCSSSMIKRINLELWG